VSNGFYEPVLFPKHLPDSIRIQVVASSLIRPDEPFPHIKDDGLDQAAAPAASAGQMEETEEQLASFKDFRREALKEVETAYLRRLMRETQGNIKRACAISGLGRTRLYTLLKENNVDRMGWN
jgi:two-component system NtrC family response regulator